MANKVKSKDRAKLSVIEKLAAKRASTKAWHKHHPGYKTAWNEAHPNYYAEWYKNHPEFVAKVRIKGRVWKKAHPESVRATSAVYNAAHPGYSRTWHAAKMEELAGRKKPKRCDVCKKVNRRICFDHCHKSKKFRGWLCHHCNVILGYAKDSPKLLRKLADYLEANK